MRLDGIGDKLASEIMTALFPDLSATKVTKSTKQKPLSVQSMNTINISANTQEIEAVAVKQVRANTAIENTNSTSTSTSKQPYYPSEGKLPWAVMLTLHLLGGVATRAALHSALDSKVLDGSLPPLLNGGGEKGKDACTCAIKTLKSRGLIAINSDAHLESMTRAEPRSKSKQVTFIRFTDSGAAVAETLVQRRGKTCQHLTQSLSTNSKLIGNETYSVHSDNRKDMNDRGDDDDDREDDNKSDHVFAGVGDRSKRDVTMTSKNKCSICSTELFAAASCWKCTNDVTEIDLCTSDDEHNYSPSLSQPYPVYVEYNMEVNQQHSSITCNKSSGKRKNTFDEDDVVDLTQSIVKPARPQPSMTTHSSSSQMEIPPSSQPVHMFTIASTHDSYGAGSSSSPSSSSSSSSSSSLFNLVLDQVKQAEQAQKQAATVSSSSSSSSSSRNGVVQSSSNLVSVTRTLSNSSSTMLSQTQQSDVDPSSTQELTQPKKVDIGGIRREVLYVDILYSVGEFISLIMYVCMYR